jgi:hypothetical protein
MRMLLVTKVAPPLHAAASASSRSAQDLTVPEGHVSAVGLDVDVAGVDLGAAHERTPSPTMVPEAPKGRSVNPRAHLINSI